MEDYFCINPSFKSADAKSQILEENDAILLIGDKVFDMQNNFKYSFDLGEIWKEMTGLPFVFAVWVTTLEMSEHSVMNDLQEAFEYGVSTIPEWTKKEDLETIGNNLITYYRENIKYRLSEDYYNSLNLFLQKSAKYV